MYYYEFEIPVASFLLSISTTEGSLVVTGA